MHSALPRWLPIPLLLLAATVANARGLDGPADPAARAEGLKLLKEGDALADQGKTTDAEVRYQQAMEKLLPGMRHLPFKHTVKREITPREEVGDYLRKDMESERTPEQLRGEELALKAFGLIPRELDFKDLMVRVHTQEVGAFYDPKTDTMHLIAEPGAGRKPGLLESLLGHKAGFDKDESKATIAHELCHALDDQHFDLYAMQEAVEDDDDRSLALLALIEGEATLVMMGAAMEDWSGTETAKLPAEQLGATFNLMMPFMRLFGGDALRGAPPIVSESLLFPYLRGLVFCAHLTNAEGWSALDAAFKNPPVSTEQILHPEKYKQKPDAPTPITLAALSPGEGWTELRRNTLGELQVGVLLRRHDGRRAAAGWDGDRYAVFEGPEGRLGLVWYSTWDSDGDAQEFARSMAAYQHERFGGEAPAGDAGTSRRERDGAAYVVERRGADVVVIEGFDAAATDRLRDEVWTTTKDGDPDAAQAGR
jgi:hypothetical protein